MVAISWWHIESTLSFIIKYINNNSYHLLSTYSIAKRCVKFFPYIIPIEPL